MVQADITNRLRDHRAIISDSQYELCKEAAFEIERLRAAIETAQECIEGHFEDDCSYCRNALAVCKSALTTDRGTRK